MRATHFVLSSSPCYNHTNNEDGVYFNIRLPHKLMSNDNGMSKLCEMIKAYMENVRAEAQFNVVST